MILRRLLEGIRRRLSACTLATLACSYLAGASAAMTLDQMKLLEGAAQLELTVDKLFRQCGLPAAISDQGLASGEKQDVHWGGATFRLSLIHI